MACKYNRFLKLKLRDFLHTLAGLGVVEGG